AGRRPRFRAARGETVQSPSLRSPRTRKIDSFAGVRSARALFSTVGVCPLVACVVACLLVACSSPPPPLIPSRDAIGPPREADRNCPISFERFAQAYFRIADLDRATSCIGYIEQDECILALFRDCTYDHPRSWQGFIDMGADIRIGASYDPHLG